MFFIIFFYSFNSRSRVRIKSAPLAEIFIYRTRPVAYSIIHPFASDRLRPYRRGLLFHLIDSFVRQRSLLFQVRIREAYKPSFRHHCLQASNRTSFDIMASLRPLAIDQYCSCRRLFP
jgi:hypothetical protein